jgi:PAS domain S-box-containing protein
VSVLDSESAHKQSELRLRRLVDAGRRLGSTLDRQEIYRIMRDIIEEAMPCDGFLVSTYNPQNQTISCEYALVGGNLLDPSQFPPVPYNESGGMQSQVIRTGKSLFFGDVKERVHQPGTYYEVTPDGSTALIDEERDVDCETMVMSPIRLEGEVVGVVQVSSDDQHPYTADQIELLEGLAQQLAIATTNARLFEKVEAEVQERRRAEEALRLSESTMLQTFDAMPQIAWSVLANGSVDYVNRRLLEYSGADDPEETKGDKGWASIVHPDDQKTMHQVYTRQFSAGEEWTAELRLKRHDGEYRWHLSRMVPIKDLEGKIVRWFGTSTDIHDLKAANEDLEHRVTQRTVELQNAVSELEGFTYSVSHDLRGPLRAISATSKILLAEISASLSQETKDLLDRQAHAANRLGKLIDELLRLSRISRGQMVFKEVDLTALAEAAAQEVATEEWSKAPKFEVQPELTAKGDERLLTLVLHNLIQNAVKFSPEGANVQIGRIVNGAFYVKDDGVGFDMQYHDKLWLPFERLVHDTDFPGTGIGLANVKRIVERHGGQVWAESTPDHGATFYFTLDSELS